MRRGPDGKWNFAEFLKQTPADRPVPTFVIKGGTVRVTDINPGPGSALVPWNAGAIARRQLIDDARQELGQ